MTSTYASPDELAKFMQLENKIPDPTIIGGSRSKEVLASGNGSATVYTDHAFLIDNTITLEQGSDENDPGTTLVNPTHFTVDLDLGKVTFTAAGTSSIGSETVYATYSYSKVGVSNTQMQEALDRAQSEIDEDLDNHFADGSTASPDYIQVTNEKHDGKGRFDRNYYPRNYPLPDVSTTSGETAGPGSGTTIYVSSSDGFPNTGVFLLGDQKVEYTGKQGVAGTAFDAGTTLTGTVAANTEVVPYVVEVSTTPSGSTPVWQTLTKDIQFDIDLDTGRVQLARDFNGLTNFDFNDPPRLIANRVRVSYIWGHSTVFEDIKRLTLMIASKDILHSVVRSSMGKGISDFNPETIDIDDKWIENTKQHYDNFRVRNI